MRSWRSSPPPWGMAARSATGFGLIGSPGWRSYGLSPPHCRRRSRCGSPNLKSPNNLLLMCTRPRLAVASPNKSVWLNTGRALWFELPDTYAQLSSGELSERVAETIVSETRHLDAEKRGEVDQQLKAVGVSKLGFKAATLGVRKITYEADRRGYVQRGRTERQHRRVGMRPAPDTMAVLTGYLPVEQGVACYAALQQHAAALRRLVRPTHPTPRPNLHGPLLRRTHPTPRSHHPSQRRRPHHIGKRPRHLRARQLCTGDARLAHHPHRLRLPQRAAHHSHHHTHRTPLRPPRPDPP